MVNLRLIAAGSAVFFASAAASFAQAPATSAPAGLDSLNDQRLIADLANRGLTNLLDRALDVNNVPATERDALKTLTALRQLNDPKARLTPQQRQAIVQNVARGIEAALPGLTDPQTMMQQATALLQFGVEREANTLEYWGDNPKTQAALRPVVEAVVKLLDKAAAEAQKKADALANTITGPNDPKAKQWEDAANIATSAAYTRHMVDYYRALAYDRVAPQRQQITEEAIKFLSQYDNADSTVQPLVRLRIAKLHMTRGQFDQAKELFASIAAAKDITPPPDASQQWEARYFGAMSDLLAKKPEDAQKALTELTAWQTANLPKDQSTRDGAVAACVMLQYRIESLRADMATTDAAKKEATDRAVALLIDLVKKRPDLQGVIFEQLMAKLPADVDLKTLDPLLLQGLVVRADEERQRPENEKIDTAVIRRGIDAAHEMMRRKEAVDPQLLDAAQLVLGFLYERLGEHAAAAEAFLDYLTNVPTPSAQQNQQIALDNALAIIGRLRADPATADAPATVHAYERFLPIAIKPPFNRREFAFEYARRLQLEGKPQEAVEYFRLVPPQDKRVAQARFYQMVALQQRLDDQKLSPPEKAQVVDEISRLVDEVSTQVSAALNAATTDQQRTQYRSMLVRTLLLAADLARREQNDPKRTLARLQNFESVAAGLPNEKELLGTALYTRVQAYMALGDSNSATQTLVTLLKTRPGGEGAAIVYKLLQKLNEELDQARAAGERARMKQLANNRAQLSGFLVDWAKNNPDPNIRKFTYRYSVFDAATKHLAADLEEDPAQRKAALQAALALYRRLESPESAALYQATLEANSPEAKAHEADPAVALGIGLITYDLGDYAEAQKRLGTLLTGRKLGTPTITVEQNGESKQVENDQYWEATLKLMRSNVALAAANPSDAAAQAAKTETVNYLKQLYIRYGREVGGKKWSPEFEKLRKEIAPEVNPEQFKIDSGATTEATTRPAE